MKLFISILLIGAPSLLWAQDTAFQNHVKVYKDVEVVGKSPTLRSGLDKKVFSVNQSLVSVGGSAADLLKNIPTLQVDASGNISLRGATNIKVLVDGKQSLIGGGSISQILQSIPAASIEKIEVITNPSAKYDAEGQGVINIILKKGAKSGRNGTITASAGTRNNYNTGASLNYHAGKANIYANYTFQRRNTYSNGYQNMTYLNSGDATYYSNERFPSTTINNIHILQTGVDYNLSSRDQLTLSGLYNSSTNSRNEYLTVDNLTQQKTPTQLSNRANTSNGWNTNWGLTTDLTHKFKKPGEEIDFDFAWSTSSGNNVQEYNTAIFNINGQPVKPTQDILRDTKGGKNNNYNIQLDYTLPLGKDAKLETGVRSQIAVSKAWQWDSHLDTLTGKYDADYSLINYFRTNNQVHAVYINYWQRLKAWTIQAGLRGELGRFDATLQSFDSAGVLTSTPIKINTNGVYPALSVTRSLPKSQQVQLSYTRRINRPTSRELNPLPDVSDPVNYDMGNPKLRPEDIYSIELAYKKSWQGVFLTSGFYYTQVDNVIKHIQGNPVNDATTTIPENLRRAINTGLEFIGSLPALELHSQCQYL